MTASLLLSRRRVVSTRNCTGYAMPCPPPLSSPLPSVLRSPLATHLISLWPIQFLRTFFRAVTEHLLVNCIVSTCFHPILNVFGSLRLLLCSAFASKSGSAVINANANAYMQRASTRCQQAHYIAVLVSVVAAFALSRMNGSKENTDQQEERLVANKHKLTNGVRIT